jgi:hypothetical protein
MGFTDEACLKGAAAWTKEDLITSLEKWKCNGFLDPLQVEILKVAFDKYREDQSPPFVNVQM